MPTVALCIYLKALHIFPTYIWMLIICLWTCFSMAFDGVITIGFGLSLFVYICFFLFFLTFIVCFCIYFSDCQRGQETGFTISILSSRHVMNVYCSLVWLKCLLCIFLIWRPSYFDLYMYFQVIIIYSGHILNINCLSLYKLIRTYLQSTFLLRSCRSIFS